MTQPRYVLVMFAAAGLAATACSTSEDTSMSFFVTSANPGSGGDLGGLDGADAHCRMLAGQVGADDRTWRAYLSTSTVDARDRIGNGPWYNAEGIMIAADIDELHGENNITGATALNEAGIAPNYLVGDPPAPAAEPLQHDLLTGTNADGTVAQGQTCNDWTDGSSAAQAMLGHADRIGRDPGVNSWNAVHPSQGCAMENLVPTGGAGLYYCFAAD